MQKNSIKSVKWRFPSENQRLYLVGQLENRPNVSFVIVNSSHFFTDSHGCCSCRKQLNHDKNLHYNVNQRPKITRGVKFFLGHPVNGPCSGQPCKTGVFGESSGLEENTRHKQISKQASSGGAKEGKWGIYTHSKKMSCPQFASHVDSSETTKNGYFTVQNGQN